MHAIQKFYNDFSEKLLNDYLYGNKRILYQLKFFKNKISISTKSILIIGCGSGQSAKYIAKKVASRAHILAIDISSKNIALGKQLFAYKRVDYRQADVLKERFNNNWEVIIFPDSYEHIPLKSRSRLHKKINSMLGEYGKVILTFPSPAHQKFLRHSGKGLQIVDEIVTIEDIIKFAESINGSLSYFCYVSIWRSNDYIHAIIERHLNVLRSIPKHRLQLINNVRINQLFIRIQSLLLNRRIFIILTQLIRRIRIIFFLKLKPKWKL